MRNTTDDPTWTSFIHHDHVSWFPGGRYVVEKLFREDFAATCLASTSDTFRLGGRSLPARFDHRSPALYGRRHRDRGAL